MSDIVEEVLSRMNSNRTGPPTWYQKLSTEEQAELDRAKAAFNPAVHQYRAYALALIEVATARGIVTAGEQGVIRWLKSR